MPETTTAEDLLAGAKRREATWKLCPRGDLVAEHAELSAELDRIAGDDASLAAASLADVSPAVPIAARITELEDQMRAETRTIRLRALRRHDFETIASPHRNDDGEGYNLAKMAPQLVRASIVDPAFTAEQFDQLWDDVLTEGQRDDLTWTAWAVNTQAGSIPFSERASDVMRWRAPSSTPPEPGASPAASS
jgi:hypothetical protein